MEIERLHSCRYCPKTYARACHLRRHEKNHTADPTFQCSFCECIFTRSDAARRHSRTCAQRFGRPIPEGRPGRRSHACDICSLSKYGCNGAFPCSRCETTGQACTYNRALGARSFALLWGKAPIQQLCRNPLRVDNADAVRGDDMVEYEPSARLIIFLYRYTNPRNNSMQDYFDASTTVEGTKLGNRHVMSFDTEGQTDWCLGFDDESYMLDQLLSIDQPMVKEESLDPQAGDQMNQAIEEIIAGILSTTTSGSSFATYASIESAAKLLFDAEKIPALLGSYFEIWHAHCPILNRDTFDIEYISPTLLAAMVLMGAIYLPPRIAPAARICLDAAEEYVFRHADFVALSQPDCRGKAGLIDISSLQAAFIITVLQHWDSHDESRRRTRLHRFPSMVNAARNLGLTRLRYSEAPGLGNGAATVRIEESIRLMNWIFLVDTSHAIFHRTLPQLQLDELTGSLPMSDELLAQSSCGISWRGASSTRKVSSVAEGITLLMAEIWTEAVPLQFGRLDHLDLFILIHALHEIIFRNYRTHTLEPQRLTLRRALGRWKRLWDMNVREPPTSPDGFRGFYTKADEYWSLANLFLMADSPALKKASEDGAGEDCMDGVYELIKRFQRFEAVS